MLITKHQKITFLLVCLVNLTISFNTAAVSAAIPFIARDLNVTDYLASKIITFYLIPYGFGALLYAPLTTKFSYRSIYAVVMVVFTVFSLLCGFSETLNMLMVGRAGSGISAACAIPLGLLIIGEFFNKEIRGRLVGVFFSCSFIASFLGVVLSGWVSWRWLFLMPAILSFLTAILIIFTRLKMIDKVHGIAIDYAKALLDRKILNIFIFIFALSFLYHGVHKWYGVYLSEVYGLSKLTISFMFISMVLGGAIGQIMGGYISDKKGRFAACQIGFAGLSVSIMMLIGFYPTPILAVLLTLTAFFWTVGHNGLSTILTDFPDKDRPVIASLNSSVRFLSGGIGFYVSSFFVSKSFGLTFFAIGILILILKYTADRFILKS